MKIRDAKIDDAPILARAEQAVAETPGFLVSQPHELKESDFKNKIQALSHLANATYVVVEENGKILGHARLEPMGLEAFNHIVRLTIVVHPEHQGLGVGKFLMKHLIAWAEMEPRVEKIELNVRASNARAIRLYQSLGFHFESRIRQRLKISNYRYLDDLEMGLFVKARPMALPAVHLAIGRVVSSRREALDDNWDSVKCCIELDLSQFSTDALAGLESFSHVEVLFQMNQVDQRKIETSARHPRNNTDWPKVGIFAQRGKNRPNQIGTTICRILKIEGLTLWLEGLDAIDGSPVLDIKPWVKEFGPRGEIRQPDWMNELMKAYWKHP